MRGLAGTGTGSAAVWIPAFSSNPLLSGFDASDLLRDSNVEIFPDSTELRVNLRISRESLARHGRNGSLTFGAHLATLQYR